MAFHRSSGVRPPFLASAYAVEIFLHFAKPCQMCWWQRYAYMGAGALALAAIGPNWRGAQPRPDARWPAVPSGPRLRRRRLLSPAGMRWWNGISLPPARRLRLRPALCGLAAHAPSGGKLGKPIAVASCADAAVPHSLTAEWGLSMAGLERAVSSLVLAAG